MHGYCKKAGLASLIGLSCWLVGAAAELGRWNPQEHKADVSGGAAGATALQLGVFHPIQLFRSDYDVYGLRLNLPYSKNNNMYGADVGVFGWAELEAGGLQVGLANRCGILAGAQMAALYNRADNDMAGFQCALVNQAGATGNGLQLGLINVSGEAYSGLQVGGFNYGRGDVYGLQIGVVNFTRTMTGIQLGLFNFIRQSQFITFAPVINGFF